MPNLMTQADYARHRGVTRPAVSNWKARGLLVMAEDPADGRIKVDVGRTDAKINGLVDPGRGRPPVAVGADAAGAELVILPASSAASAPGETLNTVRLELIRQQTAGHKLKNAREAGELAPVIELQRRATEMGRVARDRLQAWFRGEAEHFAAERDIRAIMAIGEAGIDQVFADLADMAADGLFSGDDVEEDEPIEEAEENETDDEAA